MKLLRTIFLLVLTALLCSAVFSNTNSKADELSVKEYDDFHHVLHELQHEALPKKDFALIRSKAGELVKLGAAIVQLGVPQGTSEAKVEEFKKELQKFDAALAKFSAAAKAGTDEQLTASFSAVHDSFETLADLLPR